jgi:hypothetical protein
MKKFKRVLVANRGEIAIRVFRACEELGIRSVAIYSEEDKNSLFRTKADESYRVGKGKSPVDAYLDINEIVSLAKSKGVDAIHPGYGFLAENVDFARKCQEEGIVFIGPDPVMMDTLGDKIKSKIAAQAVGVPTIPGVGEAVKSEDMGVIIMADRVYQDIPDAMARAPKIFISNMRLHTIPPARLPNMVPAGTMSILKPKFFKFLNISLLLPKSKPTKNNRRQRPISINKPVFSYTESGAAKYPDKMPKANAINIFLVIFCLP